MNPTTKKLRLKRAFDQTEDDDVRDEIAELMLELQRLDQSSRQFPLTLRRDDTREGCWVAGLGLPDGEHVGVGFEFDCPVCGERAKVVNVRRRRNRTPTRMGEVRHEG